MECEVDKYMKVVMFSTIVVQLVGGDYYSYENQLVYNHIDLDCSYTEAEKTAMKRCVNTLQVAEDKASNTRASKGDQKTYCAAQWTTALCLFKDATKCKTHPKNIATDRSIQLLEAVINKPNCELVQNNGNMNFCTDLNKVKNSLRIFKSIDQVGWLGDTRNTIVATLGAVVGECKKEFSFCC